MVERTTDQKYTPRGIEPDQTWKNSRQRPQNHWHRNPETTLYDIMGSEWETMAQNRKEWKTTKTAWIRDMSLEAQQRFWPDLWPPKSEILERPEPESDWEELWEQQRKTPDTSPEGPDTSDSEKEYETPILPIFHKGDARSSRDPADQI